MFKKRAVDKSNLRRRDAEEDGGGEEGGFQKHAVVGGEGEGEGETITGVTAVKVASRTLALVGGSTREHGASTSTSVGVEFVSDKAARPTQHAGDATHTSEIDTATDRDARAILERSLQGGEQQHGEKEKGGTVYRGQALVAGAAKVKGTQGPIRAPTFLRATTRFDYQPDICKDYKDTGFCGFGDSCKFLHDRGDYKSGWQQEKEWDEQQAKKKKRLEEGMADFILDEDGNRVAIENEGEDNDSSAATNAAAADKEALPFACLICRGDFKNPVVTNCGHYFCAACIMEANKKNKSLKCPAPACGKQTFGVFNKAHKLIKKGSSGSSSSSSGCDGGGGGGGPPQRGQWEDV